MVRNSRTPSKKKNGTTFYYVNNVKLACTKKMIGQMNRLQRSTDTLIPRLSFGRVVREIMQDYMDDLKIQLTALQAIQEAAETYLVQLFTDSYKCSRHAKRVTLYAKDMHLVLFLRGESDPGFGTVKRGTI
ncbi:histone H3.3-like [Sitophilus oryzae]|uniref:Histone H3.3-like n=1 Tax=Sitophilus oryzae TaxID=7048 RepID=A0A6J2YWM0_SITOR|nr:histone H3.3-like [Sitophilus oryzae]